MTRAARRALLLAALLLALASPAAAHEAKAGSLEIREVAPGRCEVTWRAPTHVDPAVAVVPVLPAEWTPDPAWRAGADRAAPEVRGTFECPGGARGARIRVQGLAAARAVVVVRATYLAASGGGPGETHVLSAGAPEVTLGAADGGGPIAPLLGGGLVGLEAVLFAVGLLLLARGWRRGSAILALAASSFGAALATMGGLEIPRAPLAAVAALSLAWAGAEAARAARGGTTLGSRAPEVGAAVLGLAHGALLGQGVRALDLGGGFARIEVLALAASLPVVLLIVLAAAAALSASLRALEVPRPAWATVLAGYAIGAFGAAEAIRRAVDGFGAGP